MASALEDLLGGVLAGKSTSFTPESGAGKSAIVKALLPAVMGLVAGGGLQKLMKGMQANGLSAQADSWVGSGKNEPVTGEQVKQAIGDDQVDKVAAEAGLPKDETADLLADALPQVVDRVTPAGRLPDPASVQQALQ